MTTARFTRSLKLNLAVTLLAAAAVATLSVALVAGPSGAQAAPNISFGKSVLAGETSTNPTSLQFGPDGRLYVAQQDGTIKAYTIKRNAANDYAVTATETIAIVKSMPNHNDDGSPNTALGKRQVTGILVAGTASSPVIYVGSSDPRIGGNAEGTDTNLDTNSGVISRLTKTASGWAKQDLVRGLPRSEENHSVNGMQLKNGDLYVTAGGNTNQGAPSNNFALLPEVALSAAILKVDLGAIGNTTYDLPTIGSSPNQPFGGNDGLNQAKLVSGGPVQVYAPGFRNAYDLVVAESGKMYTVDNGGNAGWGGKPVGVNTPGCTNGVSEPGQSNQDNFHHISGPGYYGGHPNPTRANDANTFGGKSPLGAVGENPIECDYVKPASQTLTTFPTSTNGLTEYTASNFGGAMQGDLLTASFNGTIYRLTLNDAGTALASKEALFSNFGTTPLDVTAWGDADPFPGTVWAATYGSDAITVFEPAAGGGVCDPSAPAGDQDGDGFTNSDEQASGTDPCSAADVPPDHDKDKVSDKTDPDDDNDGKPDTSDPFALDPNNGETTGLPLRYTWDPGAPAAGGLEGDFGFTGLMTNLTANYASLYEPTKMTVGGAAGAFTVDEVPNGDAKGNTQEYGFQSGVNVGPATGVFTAHTRVLAPFAGIAPQPSQSMGLFVGTGDQNNYAKLVVSANGGKGGIQFAKEVAGAFSTRPQPTVAMPGPNYVDLYLTVDPQAATVQPSYSVTNGGVTGPRTGLGGPEPIPAGWVDGTKALAAGFISTSTGTAAPPFPATWDFFEVVPGGGGTTEPPPPDGCTIEGTSANDTLTGTAGNDVICGLGGNDTIKGAGGNDTIKGQDGSDKLSGGTGDDTLEGGIGNDTADFSGSLTAVTASLTGGTATGEGSDTITSVEWLTGSSKNDTLTGNGGNNTFNGGGGADTLKGEAGTDKLNGAAGLDVLNGGLGNDSVVGGGSADNLFGDAGADTLNSTDGTSGNDSLDGGVDVDTCVTDPAEQSIVSCEQ